MLALCLLTLFDDGKDVGHHYLTWNQLPRVSSIFRIELDMRPVNYSGSTSLNGMARITNYESAPQVVAWSFLTLSFPLIRNDQGNRGKGNLSASPLHSRLPAPRLAPSLLTALLVERN